MIEVLQTGSSKILGIKLSGTFHDLDYRAFVPKLEAAISIGREVASVSAIGGLPWMGRACGLGRFQVRSQA